MNTRGVTLPELIIVLLLAGVGAQLLITPVRRHSDALLLFGAREEVVALIHQARMEARVRGASWLWFEEGSDPVLLVRGPREGGPNVGRSGLDDGEALIRSRVPLAPRGVNLEIAGDREVAELVYGPLGVAQFAATTLVLRKRGRELRLVISSYGRVRR